MRQTECSWIRQSCSNIWTQLLLERTWTRSVRRLAPRSSPVADSSTISNAFLKVGQSYKVPSCPKKAVFRIVYFFLQKFQSGSVCFKGNDCERNNLKFIYLFCGLAYITILYWLKYKAYFKILYPDRNFSDKSDSFSKGRIWICEFSKWSNPDPLH